MAVQPPKNNLTFATFIDRIPALTEFAKAIVARASSALAAAGFAAALSAKGKPHATIIGGEPVLVEKEFYNANFLNNRGELRRPDYRGLVDLMKSRSRDGVLLRVRFGGFHQATCTCTGDARVGWSCLAPGAEFHSCDRTPYQGSFYLYSRGPAMMSGWPDDGKTFPHSLFGLRAAAENIGFLDKYHSVEKSHWQDDDFYIKLGSVGEVPRPVLDAVEVSVRSWMSMHAPIVCDVRLEDVAAVLYRNTDLEPGKGHVLESRPLTRVIEDPSILDHMLKRVQVGAGYEGRYPKWKAAISGARLEQGRRKYVGTGEPLPYPGCSVIYNVEPGDDLSRQIATIGKELQKALRSLTEEFAFVKAESFHITTFDLINEPEFLEKGLAGYEKLSLCVRESAVDWLRNHYSDLRGTARIVGAGLFASDGVLKLDVEFDRETATGFAAFRSELHAHLCATCRKDGYTAWREESWAKGLSAHITLAYLIHPLDIAEADALVAAINDFNDHFAGLEFVFTRGDVMKFDDMDHYFPL